MEKQNTKQESGRDSASERGGGVESKNSADGKNYEACFFIESFHLDNFKLGQVVE